MEETYEKAFVEVIAILKKLPPNEYQKIPKEKIEFFENNADKNYKFNINASIPLENQNISKKANAIIVALFRDYFATQTQKEKLKEILTNNWIQEEERKQKEYDSNNIFKKNERDAEKESTKMVVHKKNLFQKILDKIKNIFRKY